ncbi:endomucin isoform X2 [Dromiciops gliroides]|uniref:endomucin isoform X2 n=1 Tax=Dromiciops gliroides TaxID=33562 RepID=UPI001CC3E3BF|nr:endomucin isoform X2 [Dromiciops gliroides]
MKLLRGAFLFLSICILCYSEESKDPTTNTPVTKPMTTQSQSTVLTTPAPFPEKNETVQTSLNTQEKPNTTVATFTSTVGPSLSSSLISSTDNGTLKEQSSTPMVSTKSPSGSAVTKTEKGTPQSKSPTDACSTANPQDHQFQSNVSATQSSQKSNHTLTPTKKPENTLGMITTPHIRDQGSTKDYGNTSSLQTNSSYSSVILPVVIALIAITLSVFTLVGLYRMCWKTDPGTTDNGTDQPQSDKESVKLLTVKTISPETSEQSAQGKNKN